MFKILRSKSGRYCLEYYGDVFTVSDKTGTTNFLEGLSREDIKSLYDLLWLELEVGQIVQRII